MNRILFLLAAAIASLGVVACGPDYKNTTFTSVVSGAPGNEINSSHVTLAEGTVLKVHIESLNSDNDRMANHIATEDNTVADVAPVISDRDWLFIGNKAGETHITIKANEDTVMVLDAVVIAQPPPK